MGKLIDNLKSIFGKKSYDTFIGVVTEDGVVRSSFMDECSMSFTFFAYIKNDADILQESIYVTKKIPSMETSVKWIEPLSIIKIEGEQIIHHGQKRIKLKEVIESNVSHKDLEQILIKRSEPVIYESSILGNLTLDRRLDWYEGKVDWNGNTIFVFLSGELSEVDKMEKNVVSILSDQKEWDDFIKRKICDELLNLKNESWLEEGEMPLTAAEFISKISLESITVNDSDKFQMNYNDGDIFWGHAITVETDLEKNIEHIGIEG